MTEHDMLLMVQRQMNGLIAERKALRELVAAQQEQVAALVLERDALLDENGRLAAMVRGGGRDDGCNTGYGAGGELG